MKLSRAKLLDKYVAFNEFEKTERDGAELNFLYDLGMNKDIIDPIAKVILKTIQSPMEWMKYEEKRHNLCKSMAVKDDKGLPITNNKGVYYFTDQAEFDKAIAKLQKEYKKEIDKKEELAKKSEKFLEEEIDVEFHPIRAKYLPKKIPLYLMTAILNMLDGPPPEPKDED